MSKVQRSRVIKLEDRQGGHLPPRIQYVRSPGGMTHDQIEAHRAEVREAAEHPHGILIVYSNMDGSDSLDDLFGPDEAQEINRRHREVRITRSYGNA
jgi:hypothetical protein